MLKNMTNMINMKSMFNNLTSNIKKVDTTTILILLFVVGSCIFVYFKYVTPMKKNTYQDNKEFIDKHSGDTVDIYFFYTTWCPYCKKAKPEWTSVVNEYKNKKINNNKINFINVDCDEDTDLADKFNVEGYPTIKLVKGKQVVTYDAKVDRTTLTLFIEETLNKKDI